MTTGCARDLTFLIALALATAACEPAPIPGAADPAVDNAPGSAAEPPVQPDGVAADFPSDSVWTSSVTGAGAALILSSPDGSPLLRLSCARDPAVMAVDAEEFEQIGSEERLSFGIDDEPFVFVADVSTPRPRGVHAERPIAAEFLTRLESARQISAVYGAQLLGPHAAPEREMLMSFTNACRRAAGSLTLSGRADGWYPDLPHRSS